MIVHKRVQESLPKLSDFSVNSIIFDIETTGLDARRSHVCLLGIAEETAEGLLLHQWMPESPLEEKEVLLAASPFFTRADALIHYNGAAFDVPYLRKRYAHWGLKDPFVRNPSETPDSPGNNACDESTDKLTEKTPADGLGFTDKLTGKTIADGLGLSADRQELLVPQTDLYRELHPFRMLFGLKKFRQKDLENFSGIERKDKLSGKEVIAYYQKYLETGDLSYAEKVLLHNKEDVLHLLELLPLLRLPALFDGDFSMESPQIQDGILTIRLRTRKPLPLSLRICKSAATSPSSLCAHSLLQGETSLENVNDLPLSDQTGPISAGFCLSIQTDPMPAGFCLSSQTDPMPAGFSLSGSGRDFLISIQGKQGEFRHFFSPYKDYYYFPLEDQAYHKSVAQFTDASHRVKATAATCYQRRSGFFYPQPKELITPVFYEGLPRGISWFSAEALLQAPASLQKQLIASILQELLLSCK